MDKTQRTSPPCIPPAEWVCARGEEGGASVLGFWGGAGGGGAFKLKPRPLGRHGNASPPPPPPPASTFQQVPGAGAPAAARACGSSVPLPSALTSPACSSLGAAGAVPGCRFLPCAAHR